jgi:hypothetical protein
MDVSTTTTVGAGVDAPPRDRRHPSQLVVVNDEDVEHARDQLSPSRSVTIVMALLTTGIRLNMWAVERTRCALGGVEDRVLREAGCRI